MSKAPLWLGQLTWEVPWNVAALRARIEAGQNPIPSRPGCYVFTATAGKLVPGKVLYVGKADDLRTRISGRETTRTPRAGGYLVDYMKTAKTRHKGCAFLFEYRYDHGDDNLYVRWAIIGDPIRLEGALIDYLKPDCNDRQETVELADDELLDPSLLP